ncbi:MAG: hypothetical protein R3B37_15285 [Nitrospira sp.]|nr:hypothetical protein [Nitrospira sp.]
MRLSQLAMTSLEIPFRQAFTHASATRTMTETVLVRAESAGGLIGMGEGCPRRYVTGETVAGAREFFSNHQADWLRFTTVEELRAWGQANAALIDRNPAAWCAVETACLDLLGKETDRPIEAVLGGNRLSAPFRYSTVLGAEKLSTFQKQLHQYLTGGFTDFKVKVTGDLRTDRERVAAFMTVGPRPSGCVWMPTIAGSVETRP